MSVKTQQDFDHSIWFITFTCFEWKSLIEITGCYDMFYKWFDFLKKKKLANVISYVIMPNHFHAVFDLQQQEKAINAIVGNGKRFIAYELVKRLKAQGELELLQRLENGLSERDKKKGQKHRVFEGSFDGKAIHTKKFLHQKVDYIHNNPVKGKWMLVTEFTDYEHSSASFYELDLIKHFEPKHYHVLF